MIGKTYSCMIPFISAGTPGNAINVQSVWANNKPGAVPRGFFNTVQAEGTKACSLFLAEKKIFLDIYRSCKNCKVS